MFSSRTTPYTIEQARIVLLLWRLDRLTIPPCSTTESENLRGFQKDFSSNIRELELLFPEDYVIY